MKLNYDRANERIKGWAGPLNVLTKLRVAMDTLGIKHSANSKSPQAAQKALKDSYRKSDGLIQRISYQIPRHMIFVHKGVGRGTPIDKVGTTGRKAKPWFNPVIEANIDDLGDIVANELGDEIVNNILIK